MKKSSVLTPGHGVVMVGIVMSIALLISSCEHRELFFEDFNLAPVRVVIHWDDVEAKDMPTQGMCLHLFPFNQEMLPVRGGLTKLAIQPYMGLCYDYEGNDRIYFRNQNDSLRFEAFSLPSSGLYNTYGPGAGSNEPTVSEPYPYTFFADKLAEPFTPLLYDTLQVDFYPKNLLREFTFLIYDISGATRISQARGAISGMAGAYKMYSQELNPTPSTVLFGTEAGRVQWKSNAQTIKWTQSMLNSVFPSNATLTDWPQAGQDSRWPDGWDDPQTGWTGDWVMGTFCTFGPVDIKNIRNNLTVEVISQENGYYFGLWGNVWTDNVREQIEGAMGVQGTRAEQLAWRKKNGGFDIVIFNDGRLNVPEGPPASGGSGGFEVNTDDWKNVDVRL